MFTKYILNDIPSFEQILSRHETETLSANRQCAVLISSPSISPKKIPLLRTTSHYTLPAQTFSSQENQIIEKIQELLPDDVTLNHATLEVYDHQYRKMRYHTDQYLDIAKDTYIALVSIYENPLEPASRTLFIKDKVSGALSNIEMTHNSVIIFPFETNYRYLHKIIATKQLQNKWLGLTFRTCKTFIQLNDKNQPLHIRLATESEKEKLFHLKHKENESTNDIYEEEETSGDLVTMNPADILPPII